MLKVLFLVAVICGVCNSAPQDVSASDSPPRKNDTMLPTLPPVAIIKYENQVNLNMHPGSYKWAYETGNGIKAQEEGYIKNPGEKGEVLFAQGSFSYRNPDGEEIQLEYTADDNGFNPVGNHLPTPPPVPPEILAALEKNAADEAAGIFDDGKYKPDSSGQYTPDDSGKYTPDNSGKYIAESSGSYRPSGSTVKSRSTGSTTFGSSVSTTNPGKPGITGNPKTGFTSSNTSNRGTPTSIGTPAINKPTTTTSQPSVQTNLGSTIKYQDASNDKKESTNGGNAADNVTQASKTTESTKQKMMTESSTISRENENTSKRTTRNLANDEDIVESESMPAHCYVYMNDEIYLKTTVECVDYLMFSVASLPGPPYLFDSDRNFGQRIGQQDDYNLKDDYYFETTIPANEPSSFYLK